MKKTPAPDRPKDAPGTGSRIAGSLILLLGLAVMVVAFFISSATGGSEDAEAAVGNILIAVGGFLVAAAGTDIRRGGLQGGPV